MQGTKVYMWQGDVVQVIGCYSEAFCHCKHAGKPVGVELVAERYHGDPRTYYSAAVHRDGNRFTGFTTGEAGIYQDEGGHYTYKRADDDKGDADPDAVFADTIRQVKAAFGH